MSYQKPRAAGRGGGGGDYEGYAIGALALLALALVVGAWGAAELAAATSAAPKPPGDPFELLGDLAGRGRFAWAPADSYWAAGLGGGLFVLAVTVAFVVAWRQGKGHAIDRAARNLSTDRGLSRYTDGKAKLAPGVFAGPGPVIGTLVPGAKLPLRATWEDMLTVVAGPRTGKTTCYAVPAILDAPGPVIVTSNKRDIVDATRGAREAAASASGGRCWVFDPQGVAGAGASWWWDPLSYVTDVRSARKLAAVWANASKEPGERTDAYFDNAGQELLAQLLLAAASAGKAVSQVYRWLQDPDEEEPVQALAGAGHELSADGLRASIHLPDRQRAGVYGTAARVASFLSDPRVLEWVEGPGGTRPQFVPEALVGSQGTLYSLSREGEGSSGPLVTALTAAVLEAAEAKAAASVGGRLALPLLAVLDEVANVCRWRELPDLYSHYGSRGIVVLSILQSWAQGEGCWGEQGMRKLWDASNVKVFAGGVSDLRFLEGLSQLYGEYERMSRSRTSGPTGSSVSWSTQRQRALSVDALAAMPAGRAAVSLSGTRPVIVETVPWMRRLDAAVVEASLARYGGPGGHSGPALPAPGLVAAAQGEGR
ncbi:MAG: TraM recognition domain-containing protein [Actinomycetota bacterium]|nr:TraM recognition domain-containing protein [Actinomycetota bacterium]